jgi:hypothetical protein
VTYVAEPYSHVVEHLLTGLTGGVAREEHRFFVGGNSFGFKIDGDRVLFETITVTGIAGGAFFVFEQGRDWVIDPDDRLTFLASEDGSTPSSGATWPDEATEFYLSYYHLGSAAAPLTDRNVGSVTRTLAEAFGRELSVLQRQLELVYRSGFVDTADGPALDMVVALLGVTRKTREFATGSVRFFRDSPAPADIYIPAGIVVSTSVNPAVPFTTTAGRTLRRGQLAVEADVRAEDKGAAGVVDAGAITVVNQTILGISGVVNEAPTLFGGAGESDDELRARVKKVIERAGRATPGAIVNALTQVGGLKENDIKLVEELELRPGVVKVFVARDPTRELATDVQAAILETRPAGVRFEHNLDVALLDSPESGLPGEEGREEGITEAGAEGGDFRVPLCCDVFVYPQNPRVTGPERSALEDALRGAVVTYVESAAIGGVLVYNRVVGDLMAVPGVLDIVLNLAVQTESADCSGMRNLQLSSGQKATIDPAAVTVRFAGAPMNFDFQIAVTLKEGATIGDARKEIRDKLVEFFAATPTTVATPDLMTKLGVSDLYILAPADLKWIAEYDQAGLIMREEGGAAAATTIAESDRASLREIAVEPKEPE